MASERTCREAYRNEVVIDERVICAGNGEKDTCQVRMLPLSKLTFGGTSLPTSATKVLEMITSLKNKKVQGVFYYLQLLLNALLT